MRSSTPGNESALSVKTVPRIRKSFAWLYVFLLGLLGVTAGNCGVPAEAGGAGSWAWPNSSLKEATSAAVQRIMIHCWRCIYAAPCKLDGSASARGCQAAQSVPITPRRLLRLSRHHHRRSGRHFLLACLLRLRLRRHRFRRNIQGNGSRLHPPYSRLHSGGTRTVPATVQRIIYRGI